MRRVAAVVAAIVVAAGLIAWRSIGANEMSVSFLSPAAGATVVSPVRFRLAAHGITIEPAGPIHEKAGHFHVMVDVDCFRPGAFVEVRTPGFEHLGDGASTIDLDLAPGKHTLCLQVGNGAHVTLAPTDRLTITVVAPA
jgi:hypothetical protein